MTAKEIQILGVLIVALMVILIHDDLWAEPKRPDPEPAFSVKVEEPVRSDNEVLLEVKTVESEDCKKEYETELLARCVEAEAGNQSLLGKRLVVDVILNRVANPDFPSTIKEVIYQSGQFGVVANGSIYTVTPSSETMLAIALEQGNRIETEIMYFNAGGYPAYGKPYERVGDHYFSK